MQRFTNSVRNSLANENWMGAVFLALAIPDICASLQNPPTGDYGEVGRRYRAWFNQYLQPLYAPANMLEALTALQPEMVANLSPESRESIAKTPPLPGTSFTADDCYRFRNKCLHQGFIERMQEEKFVFITPPPVGSVHRNVLNGQFQMQIDTFCNDVCSAAETWAQDTTNDSDVQLRIQELITIEPYEHTLAGTKQRSAD